MSGSLMRPFQPTVVRGFCCRKNQPVISVYFLNASKSKMIYFTIKFKGKSITSSITDNDEITHKYARIMISRPSHLGMSALRSLAYSIACSGLWIEHGPTTTITRSSSPARMRDAVKRARAMVCWAKGLERISCRMRAGWISGSYYESSHFR